MEIPIDDNKVIPNQSDILLHSPIKMLLKIPKELFDDFEDISGHNFAPTDNGQIETIAYILGEAAQTTKETVAVGLLYPDQDGFSHHVSAKGKTIYFATKVVGPHSAGIRKGFPGWPIFSAPTWVN